MFGPRLKKIMKQDFFFDKNLQEKAFYFVFYKFLIINKFKGENNMLVSNDDGPQQSLENFLSVLGAGLLVGLIHVLTGES